ncbi:hypothetical protein ACVGWO_00450, partial [Enterobacter asburiae]
TRKPVTEDFAIPTDGAESPWGGAQLTFLARKASMPTPPAVVQAVVVLADQVDCIVCYDICIFVSGNSVDFLLV